MRHRGLALFGVLAGAAVLVVGSGASNAENLRSGAGLGKKPVVDLTQVGGSARAVPPGKGIEGGVGTLTYDNDIPFSREGSVATPIGNRFDNGFLDPHSISRVTFRAAGCFQTPYPQFRLTIFDINPTAMTVMALANLSGGGACSSGTAGGVLRTAMVAPPVGPHNGPFIGAVFNTPFSPCAGNTAVGTTCEGVALSMGGVDPGMGFHAIRVGGSMSTAQNLGTRNAIFRATGNNLPVELMNFDVK